MFTDRIEARWIDAFAHVFVLSKVQAGDPVAILSETQSRQLNVHLSELGLLKLGARPFHLCIPTAVQSAPVPVRSTGASQAIQGLEPVIAALTSVPVVVDCTVEGLMHAPELPAILKSGARVLNISNEHPDALERLLPTEALKAQVLAASRLARKASHMRVTSAAGTALEVGMTDAATVGIWGYTDKPGTLSHWPGGLVVSFPKANSVNGALVLDTGDINLTFKRYLQSPVRLTIEDDYVTNIEGHGTDVELMRRYWVAWDDPAAYAVSHVGWGLNRNARYEALTMYDQRDTNGTELRAFAGNFLFSTGANEFAGRFTKGHFDLPVRGCTIELDGVAVVVEGEIVDSGW
ncbi:peptidase M29 [Chloroflexi bacterium TSY]|nr:peptidase M29 [Chloroflexi bacterium TSY]